MQPQPQSSLSNPRDRPQASLEPVPLALPTPFPRAGLCRAMAQQLPPFRLECVYSERWFSPWWVCWKYKGIIESQSPLKTLSCIWWGDILLQQPMWLRAQWLLILSSLSSLPSKNYIFPSPVRSCRKASAESQDTWEECLGEVALPGSSAWGHWELATNCMTSSRYLTSSHPQFPNL